LAARKQKDVLPLDNVVHPCGLRRKNLSYIMGWCFYYAWVMVFATWWAASPATDLVFDTEIRILVHAVMLLSSGLFLFFLRKDRSGRGFIAGGAILFAGSMAFCFLPSPEWKLLSAVLAALAMGCLNICILLAFVFSLNNTEKLYAVVGSNLLLLMVLLFRGGDPTNAITEKVLFLGLLFVALSAFLFWKPENRGAGAENLEIPKMRPLVYLSLLFNSAIIILCKGAGKGILNIVSQDAGNSVFTGYYAGGLAGCLLYVIVYAFTQKAYIWLGNLTFSSVAISFLCNAFIPQTQGLAVPFAVFLGLGTTIGMINMYYIIGIIAKKYNSVGYLRWAVLLIGVCGGLAGIFTGDFVSRNGTPEISLIVSVLASVVMLGFMFVSPVMERAEYVNDWGRDSANTEVGGSRFPLFKAYGLSKREAEVCELLLQGYTLRQISAILSIAYSTVNTYCTSMYRKLEINSRTELLLKFKEYIIE